MKYEITHLRNGRCAVRPAGCLGTCGWIDGKGWEAIYFSNERAAQRWIKENQA